MENYRYFDKIAIEFDPVLTVLVGENGRGKSSIFKWQSIIHQIVILIRMLNLFPTNYICQVRAIRIKIER
jgi:predicted ATP-binding protein involved in virulence